MHVAIAILTPVLELDAQLDAALSRFEKFGLLKTEGVVEIDDGGNGCLADTDNPNVIRLNQGNRNDFAQRARKKSRRVPPCGTSTDDDHSIDSATCHSYVPPIKKPRPTERRGL